MNFFLSFRSQLIIFDIYFRKIPIQNLILIIPLRIIEIIIILILHKKLSFLFIDLHPFNFKIDLNEVLSPKILIKAIT